MTDRTDRFALQFAILFLSVLLAMFLLFHVMRAYDGVQISSTWLRLFFPGPSDDTGVFDFSEAFHVNLFLIDLSLLLVVESLLAFVFVRHTVGALLVSCVGVLGVTGFGRGLMKHESVDNIVLLLTYNSYAQLTRHDGVLLVALNALLLAFLIAMMHHYRLIEFQEHLAKIPSNVSPEAGGSTPGAQRPEARRETTAPESRETEPADRPAAEAPPNR
ncbi:MAG: hypothetical protein JW889_11715 [Verrucomicrobia bacterium]|nr:hypothetical protein [Verrucomicrobiota bacterium]